MKLFNKVSKQYQQAMKKEQENWRKFLQEGDYRTFLRYFKTEQCTICDPHPQNNCFYYHCYQEQSSTQFINYLSNPSTLTKSSDRRRNPYSKMNQIIYNAQLCQLQNGDCNNEHCSRAHNYWEFYYHPYLFKTLECQNFYDCQYTFCSKLHFSDYRIQPKTNSYVINFSEFFRFDLNTFKTIPCKKQQKHDRNFCLFYHNPQDCRRPNFKDYGHIQCKKDTEDPCLETDCPYSHNKIQQLYHPSRYKSKFCQKHYISRRSALNPDNSRSFKSLCRYGQFCSFAHNQSQLSVQLIDKFPKTLQFHLYVYKTVWCPITTDHNRSQCVYAHNIQDYRRNPKEYYYEPQECPDWKKNQNIKGLEDAGCPRGMNCQMCHGWKEKQYHPVIFSKQKQTQPKTKENQDCFTSSEGNKEKTDSSQPKEYMSGNQAVQLKIKITKGSNKLQDIVQEKLKGNSKPYFKPGTPFFKPSSKSIKLSKSKSQKGDAMLNEERAQKYSQMVEKGSVDGKKKIYIKSGVNFLNVYKDDYEKEMFKVFDIANDNGQELKSQNVVHWKGEDLQSDNEKQEQKKNQERSRSVGNKKEFSCLYYSNQMTEVLNSKIIGVLQEKKINEIKLINMEEEEIKKIDGLTSSQKNLLIVKINNSRPLLQRTPAYTKDIEKFFYKYRRVNLLEKMKNKKVKQKKLQLLDSEIKELSFLTESEKNELPHILKEFNNKQEFDSIYEDIEKEIGCEK